MTIYSLILTIHIATASSLLIIVLYADHLAFSWVRGKKETLPTVLMSRIHTALYIGLGIMLVTGAYMFLPLQNYLLHTTAFQVKMGLLAVLVINSLFIGKPLHISTTNSFASLDKKMQLTLLLSGGISAASWLGIIVAANLLGL